MRRRILLTAALSIVGSSWLAIAQDVKPLPSIEVTAPKDVALVDSVNDGLRALSANVSRCVMAGGAAETCRCSFPQDLSALRRGYDTLIRQHPEWKDQLLSYRYLNKDGRNISGTLVLQNLCRQLDALPCRS